MASVERLTRSSYAPAVEDLCRRDSDLAEVVRKHGVPPLWSRRPGFPTLVHIILEQQVSLASALAIYKRLAGRYEVSAEVIAELEPPDLRACGLTGQKSRYCIELARAIVSGALNLASVRGNEDAAARRELLRITGIGPWTADIYLLMALRRPDIWPDGDLALAESAKWLKRLNTRPDVRTLRALVEPWSPWRAVGARILWHSYLCGNRGEADRNGLQA